MSSDLGAVSTYALTQHKMQIAMIKASNDMDQAVIELLNNAVDESRAISASSTHGNKVDVSI